MKTDAHYTNPFLGGALGLVLGLTLMGLSAAPTIQQDRPNVSVNGLSVNGLAFNGLSVNGLAVNGLAVNGLAVNGLAVNGLAVNGLSTNDLWTNGLTANNFNGLGGGALNFVSLGQHPLKKK